MLSAHSHQAVSHAAGEEVTLSKVLGTTDLPGHTYSSICIADLHSVLQARR